MKQGATLTKFIFLMLLLALIAYGIFAAIASIQGSITTVTAIAYEVGDGFQATGFVVRDETVLPAPTGISVLLRSEGERVAKGEALAATYADTEAQEAQLAIDELEKELQLYETVLSASSIDEGNAVLDDQIQQELLRFTQRTARGDLSSADEGANELKAMVQRRFLDETGREAMQSQAQKLRAELASLRTRLAGAVTQTNADYAGYFSGTADGYESFLTPKSIQTMTVQEFYEVSARTPASVSDTIGRLIGSYQWYFACVVEEEQLDGCEVGSELQVDFAYDFYETLTMTVERISDAFEGKRLVVLSCDDYMEDVASLREQSADVASRVYSGIRVPKQALRYDNATQQPGVFVLEGAQATWKPVEIIYETQDYFLVRQDKSDTDHLWAGDELIITSQELTDGKVVI